MQFAHIDNLKAGQVVWLDGGFTCHLPGQTILCDDGGSLAFYCCQGKHNLDGQLEDDGIVTGVWDKDPGKLCRWQQADACPAL